MTDYTMHHNRQDGLYVCDFAVVDIHGKATDIHTNGTNGISAYAGAKVQIHLPSTHNTTHDNGDEDRFQEDNATITNVND